MTIRRIQGLALIVGAVISLIIFFGSDSTLFHILGVITALLFIFGIPAVNTTQRSGSLGLIGIVLLILKGLLNTLAGLVYFRTLNYPFSIVVVLLGAAALLGYGFRVFQKSGKRSPGQMRAWQSFPMCEKIPRLLPAGAR